jgi:hypothetical protein
MRKHVVGLFNRHPVGKKLGVSIAAFALLITAVAVNAATIKAADRGAEINFLGVKPIWMGSYQVGGTFGWCVDPGYTAPDQALAWSPIQWTSEPPGTDGFASGGLPNEITQRRIAWLIGRNAFGDYQTESAGNRAADSMAIYLALRDLQNSTYAGFTFSTQSIYNRVVAGANVLPPFPHANQVDIASRALKMYNDAVAHGSVITVSSGDAYGLTITARNTPSGAGAVGTITAHLQSNHGDPVSGINLHVIVSSGAAFGDSDKTTDGSGNATWSYRNAASGTVNFRIVTTDPLPITDAILLTSGRAGMQRVIPGRISPAQTTGSVVYNISTPTTVPVTQQGSTTTTRPPTTTTTVPPTTTVTTRPPTTTTSSIAPTTTSTPPSDTTYVTT